MSSNSGLSVPEGQYPPFTTVTPNDHTAWILIPTAVGLTWFLFFGCLRVLVRLTFSYGFGLDDYTLHAATVLATIQSSIILGACSKGLGKAVDLVSPGAQDKVQMMYYTSNLFFILATGVSKISVVCFLHRISQINKHRLVFNIAIGLVGAWTIGSLLATALQCNLRHPWISVDEECPDIFRRLVVICALDVASEVAIVGIVVFLVYTLQSPMSTKVTVVGIFSFRLLTIIPIAFRLHTFDQAGYTTNPFILEARFIAWTQTELTCSLVSATVPSFRKILRNLNTGFGGLGATESGYGSGSGSHVHKKSSMSYQMSKLRSANISVGLDEPDNEQDRDPAPARTTNMCGLGGRLSAPETGQGKGSKVENGDNTSVGSYASGRMMIRKDVQWSVRTEPRH